MKKFFANIKSKLASMKNKTVISVKTALASTSGEGYIDTGVKIIIGVVIGGVILAGAGVIFFITGFIRAWRALHREKKEKGGPEL